MILAPNNTCGLDNSLPTVATVPPALSSEVTRDADAALLAFKKLIHNPLVWVVLAIIVLFSLAGRGK